MKLYDDGFQEQEPAFQQRTVHKFHLMHGETRLQLSPNAMPLHVGAQNNNLLLWVEVPVPSSDDLIYRTFQVYGTGMIQRTDVGHSFIGTVLDDGLVWHVYETFTEDDIVKTLTKVLGVMIGEDLT